MNRRKMMQSTLLAFLALAGSTAFAAIPGASAGSDAPVGFRQETARLGAVNVPAKVWGTWMQRSLAHFSNGGDLMPRGLIKYAILKKGAVRQLR